MDPNGCKWDSMGWPLKPASTWYLLLNTLSASNSYPPNATYPSLLMLTSVTLYLLLPGRAGDPDALTQRSHGSPRGGGLGVEGRGGRRMGWGLAGLGGEEGVKLPSRLWMVKRIVIRNNHENKLRWYSSKDWRRFRTAIMMDYFSGQCAGDSLLPARHYGAVYGVDGGDGSEGGLRALRLDKGGRGWGH